MDRFVVKLSQRRVLWLAVPAALLLIAGAILLVAPSEEAATKTKPNARAVLVKDINPGRAGGIQGPAGDGSYSAQLASVGSVLYLSANDGEHGYELWRSDGGRRGARMVRDINPGSSGSLFSVVPSSSNAPFYFFPDDGIHGRELWRSDGTGAGTTLIADLKPGPLSGGGAIGGGMVNLDGTLYIPFHLPPNPLEQGLWRSDGTQAGTEMVKQIINIRALTAANGTLYFGGAGDDPTFKIGFWRSDGTPAGTTNIREGTIPTEIVDVGGILYLAVADGDLTGLWRSDGTGPGTEKVKDTALPQDLTEVAGTLYFLAPAPGNDPHATNELWRSDGTAAGTSIVKRFQGSSEFGAAFDHDLTAFRGRLYFTGGGVLWRSDGTPEGTKVVLGTGLSPKAVRKHKRPKRYFFGDLATTGDDGALYLTGSDRKHGPELWRSDGTRRGTKMVRDIRPGDDAAWPMYLTPVGRTLFFSAKDGRHGRELWKVPPGR